MLDRPVSRPSVSYAEALSRAQSMISLDDHQRLSKHAHTALLDHGSRRPWAVVLLHGLTNHAGQYLEFAPQVFATGANVLVPRFPKHGYEDRLTDKIASLSAEEVLNTTSEAIDIACGLGERVAILGISLGGLLSAYFGQFRADVTTAVPVAPDFSLLRLPHGLTLVLEKLMVILPNFFMWWDPRIREHQRPKTAYPRFSTHALMRTLQIGDDVYKTSKTTAPLASRIATVVNRVDPAVNNEVTRYVVENWQTKRETGIEYIELGNLPENHDIIDPDNPQAKTQLVYPRLLEALALS